MVASNGYSDDQLFVSQAPVPENRILSGDQVVVNQLNGRKNLEDTSVQTGDRYFVADLPLKA